MPIFKIVASAISIYSFLCFVRILLTWFPNVSHSPVSKILSSICDPYLLLFRRLRFLNFGGFDFSPAAAICVLAGLATIANSLANTGRILISTLLVMIIQLFWSFLSSIIFLMIIILIVRLITILVTNDYGSYNSLWGMVDRIISSIIYRLTGVFSRNTMPYKKAIIFSILMLLAIYISGKVIITLISALLASIPF